MQAFFVAALFGFACYRGPVSVSPSVATEDTEIVSACLVADTSAPTRDTIYTIGVEASAGELDCEGRAITGMNPPNLVALTAPPGSDLRDLLDRGSPDVVVTRDADLIAWAVRSGSFHIEALPWTTTYVLAVAGADSAATILAVERDALARDAVTVDARGAVGPFTWLAHSLCTRFVPMPARDPRPVVAYAAGDLTARQLAERVAARSPAAPRVAAIPADSVADALGAGSAAAAVFAVPRDSSTACRTPVVRGAAPLIDTRAHVIVRRGSGAAFVVAADGSLRFTKRRTP